MAGLLSVIGPDKELEARLSVWRVAWFSKDVGMGPVILLCEALKLARFSRVLNVSGIKVSWFPETSLYPISYRIHITESQSYTLGCS